MKIVVVVSLDIDRIVSQQVCYLRREVYKRTYHHRNSTDTQHRHPTERRESPAGERCRRAPPRTSFRQV